MTRRPEQLPGASFLDRILSRNERQAASRDFLLRTVPKQAVCIEVGVFDGDFSERILAITQPKKLHLVDPWTPKADGTLYDGPAQRFDDAVGARVSLERQYQHVLERFKMEIDQGQVEMHRMLSHEAAPLFPDAHFDWAYIDASHYYADCKHDLETYLPKIKLGGFICGDDYDRRGFWEHGVTRAVDEFAKRHAVDVVALRNHQFILRKR
jgi:Methyltransferase domain